MGGGGAKGSRPDHYPSFERLSWYSRGIRLYRRYSTRRSRVSGEWYARERSFETTNSSPPPLECTRSFLFALARSLSLFLFPPWSISSASLRLSSTVHARVIKLGRWFISWLLENISYCLFLFRIILLESFLSDISLLNIKILGLLKLLGVMSFLFSFK